MYSQAWSAKFKLRSGSSSTIRNARGPISLDIGPCNAPDTFLYFITVPDTFFLLIILWGIYIITSNY